jgi:predicted nucleic acid-binding protein
VTVFVDTSALYAALDTRDEHSEAARAQWTVLLNGDEDLVTSNYVLVESNALLARRSGIQLIRAFESDFVPALAVVWVDAALHERGVAALLTAGLRDLSLVDCVSFEIMRTLRLDTAFAFDDHFSQQGFRCIP